MRSERYTVTLTVIPSLLSSDGITEGLEGKQQSAKMPIIIVPTTYCSLLGSLLDLLQSPAGRSGVCP